METMFLTDGVILDILHEGRRARWTAGELAWMTGMEKRDVLGCLERLHGAGLVVRLSTRYIARDRFTVPENITPLDIAILRAVRDGGGLRAGQACHALWRAGWCVASSTILNHMRVLRSPGWGLLEKKKFRGKYMITPDGAGMLASMDGGLDQPLERVHDALV